MRNLYAHISDTKNIIDHSPNRTSIKAKAYSLGMFAEESQNMINFPKTANIHFKTYQSFHSGYNFKAIHGI